MRVFGVFLSLNGLLFILCEREKFYYFLLDTDIKMRAKISSLMEILEEYGNLLREPYSKYLRDGIFELRCQSGNNISRILYFFYCDNKIIMTNGFIKKTNKTPKKEIELAKLRKADYIERMMNK